MVRVLRRAWGFKLLLLDLGAVPGGRLVAMAAIAVSIRSTPLMVLGTRSAAATPRGVHTDRADQIPALLAIADVPAAISSLGWTDTAGIVSTTTVWAPGASRCRQRNGRVADDDRSCCGVTTSIHRYRSRRLRLVYQTRAWRTIEWREGAAEPLRSRFARSRGATRLLAGGKSIGRVAAERVANRRKRADQYWLSTLPRNVAFRDFGHAANTR